MFRKILCLNIILFCIGKILIGQETFYKFYDAQDGVPSNIIYDIISDDNGYLYMATDNGIYVYNGLVFKEIPMENTKATTFTDLHLDYKGVLWVRNFANEIFIKEKDSLKVVNSTLGISSDSFFINRLLYRDSSIYINNNIELYKYNLEYKILNRNNINIENDDYKNKIWDFIVDDNNNYLLKTKENILLQKTDGSQEIISLNNPNIEHLEGKFINQDSIYYVPFRQDSFSVFVWNGVKFNNLFTVKNPGKSKLIRAFKFEPNLVWCITTGGLYVYNLSNKTLELILPKNIYVSKVIKVVDGSYWVSTIGNGLIHIPSLDIKIHLPMEANTNFTTLCIFNKNEILAGTNKGQFVHLDNNNKLVKKYNTPFQDEIQFLHYDSITNRIYHTFGYHKLGIDTLASNFNLSKTIVPLDEEHLIVGSWRGLHIINKDFDKNITYTDSLKNLKIKELSLGTNRVRRIHFDKKRKKIYVVFIDNIIVFDIQNGFKSSIIYNNNASIHGTALAANEHTLWIGTFTDGVLAMDKNTQEIVAVYNNDSNLSSNNCKRLFYYKNELWILTFKGLNKLDLITNRIINFNNQYGLEYIFASDVIVDGESVWLSGSEGVMKIKKSYFDSIKYPRLYLSQVKLKGKVLPLSDTIKLPPSPQDISIHFESAIYNTNREIVYEYKFSKTDLTWIKLDKYQQSLVFPTMEAGDYELLIRISNADKNYSEPAIKLHIKVQAHLWQNKYFIIFLVSVLILGIVTFFQFVNIRQRQKQKMREDLITHQLSAIRARMNPHFLFNILSSIQALIYINRKQDAIDVLGNFSQLMRIILDISDKDFISLEEEINTLQLYTSLEKIRFEEEKDIVINFIIDPQLDLENITIPTLLIQPIVENAFKHGLLHKQGLKILEISFEKGVRHLVDYLVICVSDNGIGRSNSEEINKKKIKQNLHKSFATKAIFKRIELINKNRVKKPVTIEYKDYFKDGVSTGTTVEILIPLMLDSSPEPIKNATTTQSSW